ncbi:MAG: hypothetical protein WBO82_07970 [Neisseria sp.]
MSKLSTKEKRELLELQVELLHLKIAVEQLKKRKYYSQQNLLDTKFMSAFNLTEGLPSGKLLWNTLLLPLNWRKRLLVGSGLFLWQLYRDTQSNESNRR